MQTILMKPIPPEASLIVPDLPYLCTAVHAVLSFLVSFSLYFLSLFISWHLILRWVYRSIDRENQAAKIWPKKRLLHERLYKEMVKSGTIRLASGVPFRH